MKAGKLQKKVEEAAKKLVEGMFETMENWLHVRIVLWEALRIVNQKVAEQERGGIRDGQGKDTGED